MTILELIMTYWDWYLLGTVSVVLHCMVTDSTDQGAQARLIGGTIYGAVWPIWIISLLIARLRDAR